MSSNKTDFCYREKRLKPFLKHQYPRFIKCSPLHTCNAHLSMYAVTEEVATMIAMAGSVRGFKPAHYNPFLWLDVDAMGSAMKLKSEFVKADFNFIMFLSGNKGAHFAIKRTANPSSDLYLRDKMFVYKELLGMAGAEDIDRSLYNKPLHLIRAVGCTHDVTKKKKTEYFRHRGSNIPDVTEYDVSFLIRSSDKEPEIDEVPSLDSYHNIIIRHHGPTGSRYIALWQMAKDLFKSGFSEQIIRKMVGIYNELFERPHQGSEVDRAIQDAKRAVFGTTAVDRPW